MIAWYWIYFQNIYFVVFMITANFLFWFSMRHDLATFGELKKEDNLEVSEEAVSDFLLMGKGLGRFLDMYGFPAVLKRIIKKSHS